MAGIEAGGLVFYLIGFYDKVPVSVLLNTNFFMATVLMMSALSSALISGQFGFRMQSWWKLGKGFVGGVLMGFGTFLVWGCIVGGFSSITAALSLSGFLMMVSLLIGTIIGLKYLS